MTADERFPSDTPGAYIDDVLGCLERAQLEQLVGRETMEALKLLRQSDQLVGAAEASPLLDFERVVRSPELLEVLLSPLPNYKLEELAERLGTSIGHLPKAAASGLGVRSAAGFFGVALDPEEPEPQPPHLIAAKVEYGLFPHQRAACKEVQQRLDDVRLIRPAVLLHMPTGAGKTRTAAHAVCRHLVNNEPGLVVWYANTQELLEQAASELETAWRHLGDREVEIARFWGSNPALPEITDGIVVCGLQKMWSLVSRDPAELNPIANSCTMVVVDEAHISLAATYRQCIELTLRRPGAGLLGLSATPGRTWNEPATDAVLSEMYDGEKVTLEVAGYPDPVEYLMTDGYLARPTFELIDPEGDAYQAQELALATTSFNADGSDDDYSAAEVERAALSAHYLAGVVRATTDLLGDGHHRVIVFAASVEHANATASLLRAVGAEAEVVTGSTPKSKRAAAINRFKSTAGGPRALVNFGVLTTGFDAPATSGAVIARPTRSLVLYSQMVGRSIRGEEAGGNPTAHIKTVVDPELPGFGSVAAAFQNWEDVW
ncbi:MAG: DEAD/DEAH box helicase family protein [Dehalococcoidia bacterium]